MKAFVNNAYACDPRVLRQKAEEKAERCGWAHDVMAGSTSPWCYARPSIRLHKYMARLEHWNVL